MCVKHDSNTLRRATNNNEIIYATRDQKDVTPCVLWRHKVHMLRNTSLESQDNNDNKGN